jgi:hypothetical protein
MRNETAVFTMLRALMPVDNPSLAYAGHAIKTA